MEKEKLEDLLIDYIDGVLDEEQVRRVDELLATDAAARQLFGQLKEVMGGLKRATSLEPSWSLKNRFDQALREEISKTQTATPAGRQVFFQPVFFRAAAAIALVAVAGAVGYWIVRNQQQQSELTELRIEMEKTRHLMMAMLENQQSASTRMKGATVAYEMEKTDDQIVAVLVRTMNQDPNTNVRLAALEALEKFNHQPPVRRALVASLATQKDPIVQIALIQLMVRMKEKGSVGEMEKITRDIQTMKAVKDEAYSGILKLS